jgi:hypothetical protein
LRRTSGFSDTPAVRSPRWQAGTGWTACLVSALVLCAAGAAATARALDDQTFVCGIQQGPSLSVPGARPTRKWDVISITDRAECANAHQWAILLGARIAGHAGEDTQVFRSGHFGCILARAELLAVCRDGNGGHGTEGVIVLGNPGENPLVPQYDSTYSPTAMQAVADLVGVPGPAATSLCEPFDGPAWKFRAADGHTVTGSSWVAYGDTFADGCPAAGDLRGESAAAIGDQAMSSRSFLVSSHLDGDWGCVAVHDYAWPGGAGTIVGVPLAGCTRVVYPFGTSSLAAELEQVVVLPDASGVTAGSRVHPATGVTTAVQQQLADAKLAVGALGLAAVAVKGTAAYVVGGTAGSGSHAPNGIIQCPRHRVGGAGWRHGSAHGDGFLVATSGGYPCELADAVIVPFLAYLVTGTATASAASLHRNGWSCNGDRTALTAMCAFDPSSVFQGRDRLATLIGGPVPQNIRVAVSADYPGAAAGLAASLRG